MGIFSGLSRTVKDQHGATTQETQTLVLIKVRKMGRETGRDFGINGSIPF